MRSEEYFRQLWDGKRNGTADRLVLTLLGLLSFPYALLIRMRTTAYAIGLFRSFRLTKPVISVGNLTIGGTGKTPMVIYLARWLMDRGMRVVVLSRGYGGSQEGNVRIVADGKTIQLLPEESGDEPFLLAHSVPGLAVVIGTDRYRAGLLALERLNPDIFILDDGFQHMRLKRNLNILLLDCGKPFASGRTLPAGALREPASAVERADLVIFTRCNGNEPAHETTKHWCAASHRLNGAIPLGGGEAVSFMTLEKRRVLAFAGIAEPVSFFESLEREGLQLASTFPFPDHCNYGESEIAALCRLKESSRADCLITTEKDAVKLGSYLEQLGVVYSARLELHFVDAGPLEAALEKLL